MPARQRCLAAVRLALLLWLAGSSLAACGRKGPLYLPAEADPARPPAVKPAVAPSAGAEEGTHQN
jgi:predicted small lipoprotein YifL